MSAETNTSNETGIEKHILNLGVLALNLTKLALLKGAIKFSGIQVELDAPEADPKPLSIPTQSNGNHEALLPEKRVMSDCVTLFTEATAKQLNGMHTYIETADENGHNSEYVAIASPTRDTLYVYRPTIADEATAQFPYWLREEVAANDVETGLPTLYYRQLVIDQLGYLQAKEFLPGNKQVYRPLEASESQPYYAALANPRMFHMVPVTELGLTVE